MSIARSMATASPRGSRFLTGESALSVRGLSTWMHSDVISFRNLGGGDNSRKCSIGEASVGAVVAPSVVSVELRGQRLGSDVEVVRGVAVASLEEIALDLARYAHPLSACVGVSVVLRELCEFSTMDLRRSRDREREAREVLVAMLETFKGKRGYRRARETLEAADAGIETPPEGVLFWLLKILLRNDDRVKAEFWSQYPIRTVEADYRPDIVFPNLKLIIEFDGAGKLIEDHEGAERFYARQRDLQAGGWRLVRFSTRNLANIPAMAEVLAKELGSLGLNVAPLGGPLWRPIPNYMRSPARR